VDIYIILSKVVIVVFGLLAAYFSGFGFKKMVEMGSTFCYGKLSNFCGIMILIALIFAWYANIQAGGLPLLEVITSLIETLVVLALGLYAIVCGHEERRVPLKEVYRIIFPK